MMRLRFHPFACLLFTLFFLVKAEPVFAGMSFCNRTSGPLEAALGYRVDTEDKKDNWVSEGWWRIEPGQCARVYADPLTQRFYFFYAQALRRVSKDKPARSWSGKYIFCTQEKAFRIEGDGDCADRTYNATGFQQVDVGASVRDYVLEFKDR